MKTGRSKVSNLGDFFKTVGEMNYKDMKRHCVSRGMSFDKVINGSVPKLSNWLHANRNVTPNTELLDKYDDYVEEQLRSSGKEYLIYPQLRLGYIGEKDEDGVAITTKKVKVVNRTKVKREKTADGIYKGTKKALTYQSQKEGKTLAETQEIVKKAFEDVSEKSVKIWYKKSERENKK